MLIVFAFIIYLIFRFLDFLVMLLSSIELCLCFGGLTLNHWNWISSVYSFRLILTFFIISASARINLDVIHGFRIIGLVISFFIASLISTSLWRIFMLIFDIASIGSCLPTSLSTTSPSQRNQSLHLLFRIIEVTFGCLPNYHSMLLQKALNFCSKMLAYYL